MLKGIDPLLNADVLYALRAAGHGDVIVLTDTNFPADKMARASTLGRLLRIDASGPDVARAVLSVMPIEMDEDGAAVRMQVVGAPEEVLPVMQEVQDEISAVGGPELTSLSRYPFYDNASKAYAVIQTGERRFYGCFALTKGLVAPED